MFREILFQTRVQHMFQKQQQQILKCSEKYYFKLDCNTFQKQQRRHEDDVEQYV